MFSKTSLLVALSSLASYVVADSAEFYLIVIRSGSQYQYAAIVPNSDNVLLAGSSAGEKAAVITDAGEFKYTDGSYLTVEADKVTVTQGSGSTGFSLSEGGYLTYKGSESVSINDSSNVVAFGNGGDGSTSVAVRAWGTDGQALGAYTPSGSSSSATTSSEAPASSSSTTSSSEAPASSSSDPAVAVQENGANGLMVGSAGLVAAAALLL
ncbi:hypothetical protein WICPIJ_009605 [Wickerhamomyces pijperi]|uniref:Cell wall protein CWP1 n=1 Tax=Wickerhamomyces pijperi TaxID=599730 RepID=A0A9P8PN74_WICPI|nr:hypothetical protein WICPIJ_009605 [Wickerhamomyces pijperi]